MLSKRDMQETNAQRADSPTPLNLGAGVGLYGFTLRGVAGARRS